MLKEMKTPGAKSGPICKTAIKKPRRSGAFKLRINICLRSLKPFRFSLYT